VEAAGLTRKRLPVCHGGTLDPFAEGLLLLLAGPATRLMEWLHAVPKTYEAEVVWGVETDNGDLLGRVVHEGDATALTPEALDAALVPFLGWREQVPPATSAKRVGGERAYEKAHRGEPVELPPSRVYLHEARWLSHGLPRRSRLRLTCRGGYYVRALARDLGRALGCGAHLARLHRTTIGPWEDPGPGGRVWLHGQELLPWCPSRSIAGDEVNDLKHGRTLPIGEVRPPDWRLPEGFPDPEAPVRALQRGRMVALLREQEGGLRTFTHLWPGL
jgi:tRNA pseudouridine55 synthase